MHGQKDKGMRMATIEVRFVTVHWPDGMWRVRKVDLHEMGHHAPCNQYLYEKDAQAEADRRNGAKK